MTKIWFDVVTRRDARLLARWWNKNLPVLTAVDGYFEMRRSTTNPRYWAVVKIFF